MATAEITKKTIRLIGFDTVLDWHMWKVNLRHAFKRLTMANGATSTHNLGMKAMELCKGYQKTQGMKISANETIIYTQEYKQSTYEEGV